MVTADNLTEVRMAFPSATVGDVVRDDGADRSDLYVQNNDGSYTDPNGVFTKLTLDGDNTYQERQSDGTVYTYAAPTFSGRAVLQSITDRNGDTIQYQYNSQGQLTTVTDTLARPIQYQYDSLGELTSVTDFNGRTVMFTYDVRGDLSTVTTPLVTGTPNGNDFPNGKTTRYTYSPGYTYAQLNGELLTVTAPNEVATGGPPRLTYTYDTKHGDTAFGAVTSAQDGGTSQSGVPAGGTIRYTYQALATPTSSTDVTTATIQDTVTDPNGNVTRYQYNQFGDILNRQQSNNRNIRPDDPASYLTTYTYDIDYHLTQATYPDRRGCYCGFSSWNLHAGGVHEAAVLVRRFSYRHAWRSCYNSPRCLIFRSGGPPVSQAESISPVWEGTLSHDTLIRAVFDALGDAVLIHDGEGRILAANATAARQVGQEPGQLERLTLQDIYPAETLTELDGQMRTAWPGGRFSMIAQQRRRDGSLAPVKLQVQMIDMGGRPLALTTVRDLRTRQLAEQRQAVQYAVTRALAEATTLTQAGAGVLQAVAEGFGWDLGILWHVDRSADVLCCAAVWFARSVQGGEIASTCWRLTFARGQGLPGTVWADGQTHWIEKVAEETCPMRRSVLAQQELRHGLAFPVQSARGTLGVVEFFGRSMTHPDEEMRRLLTALGSQIGQFLERNRFEGALRESEAFYQSLVETLPQNIIRKDAQGRFTYVNQHICAMLGLPREQIIGKTDFDLFPAHLAEKYRQDDLQVLESGKSVETVEENQTPDGRTIYVQIIKTPISDDQRQRVGTQVIFWDVTERQRWEEALRDSERRYRQLAEASQDGIVVTDSAGRITLFNPAAENMFACPISDAIGTPLERFLSAGSGDPRRAPSTLHGRRADGTEFPLELCTSRVDFGDEPQALHTIRDLTERNRMRDILVQSEKLASIGLLSAGVAHEINNPLSYVSNNLAVLDRDVKGLLGVLELYESGRERLAAAEPDLAARIGTAAEELDLTYVRDNFGRLLARTREGVQRVTRIVQSLRGLARTSTPKMVESSLPDLVDMSLEMIRGRLQRQGIAVETEYGPIRLHCVESQISQVLLNLLVNAVHAIESTGRSEGRIWIRSWDDGPNIAIEIEDNGCGIDSEHQPKLFDPFFTTKPVGEGTGLGLSISHGIINAHGGRIEVESQVGEGSRFRLYLPRGENGGE